MIPSLLHPLLIQAAQSIDPQAEPEPLIPSAKADYQWNFALKGAGNPRARAERLKPLLTHPAIASVEVAGPGFLNITLNDAWIASQLTAQVQTPNCGIPDLGQGRTCIVDYSSPNVAKRMHIGHMRSTHIGHVLYNLHKAAGWTTIGDNHIGDWGTQFGMLIVAWRKWLSPQAFQEDAIGELERLYVLFRQQTATEELMDAARLETAKLQKGDPENTALWKQFLSVSLAEFQQVYNRMGVVFDETLGESTYASGVDALLSDLEQRGLTETSQGATVINFEDPGLKDHPMIVLKKDGASNYATTDLACMRYRETRWNPARILIVTDMRQQLHFKQLFAVAQRWGCKADLQHCGFGLLTLPEGEISTRKGNVIRLTDLLNEAVRRAKEVVDKKSPHLSEEERVTIAEAVGTGAVRYADLVQNPQTNYSFDWDRMLALNGNTAPYLLYTLARCTTLLARSEEVSDLSNIALQQPQERGLALTLLRYPEAVVQALKSYRPNVLCEYLFDLANGINRFYHDLPVLQGGDARASRLALLEASRITLQHGLSLLGLTVLDRM